MDSQEFREAAKAAIDESKCSVIDLQLLRYPSPALRFPERGKHQKKHHQFFSFFFFTPIGEEPTLTTLRCSH